MNQQKYLQEYELGKYLYGTLTTLATRPFSVGNTSAIEEAVQQLEAILERLTDLERTMFSPGQFETILSIANLRTLLPLRFLCQSLMKSVFETLASQVSEAESYPVAYHEKFRPKQKTSTLIVVVGPTIGLGDELILAHTLSRAIDTETTLFVHTKRFGLWDCLGTKCSHIGDAPCSYMEFIEDDKSYDKTSAGLVYADFLESDPADLPIYLPHELQFTARWTFGKAQNVLVDTHARKVYWYKYPEFCIQNRFIESSWVVNQLVTAAGKRPDVRVSYQVQARKSVVVQLLTSKPQLILGQTFFIEALRNAFVQAKEPFDIKVIRGPSNEDSRLTDNFVESLSTQVDSRFVKALTKTDIAGINLIIRESTVLFGPDTFTSHLAAVHSIPQVTVYLREHRAWLNFCTPSLYIELNGSMPSLITSAARRLTFLLSGHGERLLRTENLEEDSDTWCQATCFIRGQIVRMDGVEQFTATHELLKHIDEIQRITVSRLNLANHILLDSQEYNPNQLAPPTLSDYRSYKDQIIALSRWFTLIATSPLSGLLFCFHKLSNARANTSISQSTP